VPGLDLAVCAQPNRVVAGDYYDLVSLSDDRLVAVVADVAGKVAPAALLMANIQAAVRLLAPELAHADDLRAALAEATGRLNRVISDNTAPGMFITMVWGVWDAGRLVYCNAGHLPPRLVRAGGTIEGLDCGGPLLGVLPDMTYEAGVAQVEPGDVVMLYSDGLTEAARPDGEEYGEERLDALLLRHRAGTAEAVRDAACSDAEAFSGHAFTDDLTILVLKATGE
jgi:serine phosphatase RsbU (regulator of sigma subunit)